MPLKSVRYVCDRCLIGASCFNTQRLKGVEGPLRIRRVYKGLERMVCFIYVLELWYHALQGSDTHFPDIAPRVEIHCYARGKFTLSKLFQHE